MFALRSARLFDGEGMVDRPTVLVDGDTIAAVGVAIPDEARVVDLGAATVLPGLIDCHQHLCFDGTGSLDDQVLGVDDEALLARDAPRHSEPCAAASPPCETSATATT